METFFAQTAALILAHFSPKEIEMAGLTIESIITEVNDRRTDWEQLYEESEYDIAPSPYQKSLGEMYEEDYTPERACAELIDTFKEQVNAQLGTM